MKFYFALRRYIIMQENKNTLGRTVAKLSQFKVFLLRRKGKEIGKNVGAGDRDLIHVQFGHLFKEVERTAIDCMIAGLHAEF